MHVPLDEWSVFLVCWMFAPVSMTVFIPLIHPGDSAVLFLWPPSSSLLKVKIFFFFLPPICLRLFIDVCSSTGIKNVLLTDSFVPLFLLNMSVFSFNSYHWLNWEHSAFSYRQKLWVSVDSDQKHLKQNHWFRFRHWSVSPSQSNILPFCRTHKRTWISVRSEAPSDGRSPILHHQWSRLVMIPQHTLTLHFVSGFSIVNTPNIAAEDLFWVDGNSTFMVHQNRNPLQNSGKPETTGGGCCSIISTRMGMSVLA